MDVMLRRNWLREGEGWLSEETVDNASRLDKERLWIVDPLDGTREFVQCLPEFCVSIGLTETGNPVAGGIYNPATKEAFSELWTAVCYTTATLPARASARPWMEPSFLPAVAK
jgi:fructose-1,6-bisphosphatase/inositol monophosphatase family enzyme